MSANVPYFLGIGVGILVGLFIAGGIVALLGWRETTRKQASKGVLSQERLEHVSDVIETIAGQLNLIAKQQNEALRLLNRSREQRRRA